MTWEEKVGFAAVKYWFESAIVVANLLFTNWVHVIFSNAFKLYITSVRWSSAVSRGW